MSSLPGLAGSDPLTIAVVVLIVALAGLVHGTLGLGFPMVATPLLSLLTDVRSAILITLIPTIAVNLWSIAKGGEWRHSIGRFWPLVGFVVLGGVVGSWILSAVDPAPFGLLLAAAIVLYLSLHRFRGFDMGWTLRHPGISLAAFGLTAGFLAGTVNVMVPVLIIYTLEMALAPVVMVQVFNLCFVTGKLSQTMVFWSQGWLDAGGVLSTLPLALVALVTLLVGMRIRSRIAAETYRGWLRTTLWVMAALLVAQFTLGS